MFRPPIVRSASAVLDRSLFTKKIPISAARIANNKTLSKYRNAFLKSAELLQVERLTSIIGDPNSTLAAKGGKCMLLKPEVKHEGISGKEKKLDKIG